MLVRTIVRALVEQKTVEVDAVLAASRIESIAEAMDGGASIRMISGDVFMSPDKFDKVRAAWSRALAKSKV